MALPIIGDHNTQNMDVWKHLHMEVRKLTMVEMHLSSAGDGCFLPQGPSN